MRQPKKFNLLSLWRKKCQNCGWTDGDPESWQFDEWDGPPEFNAVDVADEPCPICGGEVLIGN